MDKLTVEQWSMIFDCVSHRMCDLEEAKEQYPHAADFIQEKIDELDIIQSIIGPLSI